MGNVEQRPSLQPLLEEEWQRLLAAWNATQATYPKEQCIPQLFETQVERTPFTIVLLEKILVGPLHRTGILLRHNDGSGSKKERMTQCLLHFSTTQQSEGT